MNRLLTIVDSKYQRLEYLESTGTQCILTNYAPSYKTSIEVKISDFTGTWIWGARDVVVGTIDFGSAYYFSSFGENQLSYSNLQTGTHIINYGKNLIVDGNTIGTFPDTTSEIDTPILIFGIRNSNETNSNVSAGKIHYFRIYEDGVLVRNFVPVLRKTDNELGMLDLVEGKFYTNAGTGKFTANLDTMYAIIQGSPTINNGVASGFSSSNYLTLPTNFDFNTNFEFCFDFTTGSDVVSDPQILLGYILNDTEARLQIRFFTSPSSQSIQITGASLGSNISIVSTISANTRYKVIWKREGNNGTLELYDKNNTLLASNSATYSDLGTQNLTAMTIGVRSQSAHGSPFNGSINFNNSYIKLGSTKYNLQAVVGYTVVGSPTITDGVVSGFSGSDYVRTNQIFPNDLTNNYEVQVKFTTPSSLSDSAFVVGMLFRGTQSGFKITKSFGLSCFIGGSNEVKSSANYLLPSTDYIARITIKNNVLSLFCGTTESNISLVDSMHISSFELLSPTYMYFGRTCYDSSPYVLTGGSIDLNKTLVKINNKLWFNGQQA